MKRTGLFTRIIRYARPHAHLLAAAAVLLAVATISDVLVPVVIQRSVDREILDGWVRLRQTYEGELRKGAERVRSDGWTYFREEQVDRLSRPFRAERTAEGTLDLRRFLFVDAAAVQGSGVEAFGSAGTRAIVLRDHVEALEAPLRSRLLTHNVSRLSRYVLALLVLLAAGLAAGFGQMYLTALAGQRVMKDLRLELFSHTMRQALRFLNHQPVGKLVTRVTNDVETVNELFTTVLADLVRNIALMVAVVGTLFALNARLASFVVLSLVPVALVTLLFRRRAREAFRRVRAAVSAVNAFLSEYISGMAIVQVFVQQERSRNTFDEKNSALLKANLTEMYVFATFRPITEFLSSISIAVIIFFGARLLEAEAVSVGVLIAYTNLIRRFYMPVMRISEQFTVLQSALAGGERIFELLDTRDVIPETGNGAIPSPAQGLIEFDEVSFAYRPDEPVIRNLSFVAEPATLTAIVGYTGSGKTTLINLLTRLWDADDGAIRVDGVPILSLSRRSLRTTVQQIQQDVFLFADTIRANIALGAEVPDDRIWDACEAVQIAEAIRALPDGLSTVVHEGGSNLSAGQRQLISFARVLVHDPPILVLDEATASIDSETERLLQHAVQTVAGGRTTLAIAHRLSTIRHADQILVLSHGEIVQRGTHGELVEQDGLYATLYRLQFANLPRDSR